MATAVWTSTPPGLGSGLLSIVGRKPSLTQPDESLAGRRLSPSCPIGAINGGSSHFSGRVVGAVNDNDVALPLSEAPDGRCEYYSTTHQSWLAAKITANNTQTGALQIDKKPGVWISPGEQKTRLRVTKAAVDRAAKDRRENEAGQSSKVASSIGSESCINWRSAPSSQAQTFSAIAAAAQEVNTPGELGEATPSSPPRRLLGARSRGLVEERLPVAGESSPGMWYRSGISGGSVSSNHHFPQTKITSLQGNRCVGEFDVATPAEVMVATRDINSPTSRYVSDLTAASALLGTGVANSEARLIATIGDLRPSVGAAPATQGDLRPSVGSPHPTRLNLRPSAGGDLRPSAGAHPTRFQECTLGELRPSAATRELIAVAADLREGLRSAPNQSGSTEVVRELPWSAVRAQECDLAGLSSDASQVMSPKHDEFRHSLASSITPAADCFATTGLPQSFAPPSRFAASAVSFVGREAGDMSWATGPSRSLGFAPPDATLTEISAPPPSSIPIAGIRPLLGHSALPPRKLSIDPVHLVHLSDPATPNSVLSSPGAAPVTPSAPELPPCVKNRILITARNDVACDSSPIGDGCKASTSLFASHGLGGSSLAARSTATPLAEAWQSLCAAQAAATNNSTEQASLLEPEQMPRLIAQAVPEAIAEPPPQPPTTSETPEARTPDSSAPEGPLPLGETIALDEYGRPSIVRQINPDSGAARTVVLNDDGSHRVFGEHTVSSLTNSNKDESRVWLDALSCHQLRGLVHEVGQRLLEGSRLYHARLNQLDKWGEHLNYVYFGLTTDASDRDLENAYRKLAKKLHPDKNGGTEVAKKRFQQMKERYEAIKKKRNEDCEADSDNEGPPESDEEGATKKLKDSKRKDDDDAAANNAEEDAADKASSIEYDPQDRVSMEKTVGKMLGQLKNVEIQMKVVVKELGRISTQVPADDRPT